ncbi:MAG: hypothetical protein GF332_03295 [Candidatus Moranbacteria bacterium]|nr:hypothetical protein [Candidatus Moranbacteria bacterium]
MAKNNQKKSITVQCPYDDCQNIINISPDAEEADVLVCRTKDKSTLPGCNRNIELINIQRDSNQNITQVQAQILEVDEDWGQ